MLNNRAYYTDCNHRSVFVIGIMLKNVTHIHKQTLTRSIGKTQSYLFMFAACIVFILIFWTYVLRFVLNTCFVTLDPLIVPPLLQGTYYKLL